MKRTEKSIKAKLAREIKETIDQALFDFDWQDLINAILSEDSNTPWLRLSTLPHKKADKGNKRELRVEIIETTDFDTLVSMPFSQIIEDITEDPIDGELEIVIEALQQAITACQKALEDYTQPPDALSLQ